jgi:hypothetical protein
VAFPPTDIVEITGSARDPNSGSVLLQLNGPKAEQYVLRLQQPVVGLVAAALLSRLEEAPEPTEYRVCKIVASRPVYDGHGRPCVEVRLEEGFSLLFAFGKEAAMGLRVAAAKMEVAEAAEEKETPH